MITVKQAYTGAVLAELKMHDSAQVEQMLSNAQKRHQAGRLSETQRIEILQKLADLVESEHEDFSRLIANEGGKPIRDARVEVTRAISGIRIAIRELDNIVALLSNENAEKLVTDSRVAFFSFIGSAKVGWHLKSKLAYGTRCALEHGGVAPLIFDEYADEEGFVNGVVKASMYHSGQVCVSVQRVYVPEKRAQDLAEKIATIAAKQVVGDAINENTDLGPLISPQATDRIEAWVNEAIASGAQLMTGGKRINAVSYAPTVLLNPAKDAKVSTQEVFAPVVCIYGYKTLEEAVEWANSLDVSFQSSVFSDNAETAMTIAKKLQASAVMINDYTTFRVDWMPFAGRKHSGYGIGGIGYSMRDMLEHKMIVTKR
ncbi:hypothetical protein BGC33_12105 [Bathymodiolus thermophilus thioautotrophic gill symbiont]|uniref:Aldehyde dehydrogenase domain-containing protein n=2 Tax=Bathymodiolus thermophilus thioautotrophic gill symbiont TaxID=2360 RepID=A0A1J5TXH1_9GAMM|nr:aldehyde dehydrogenase family protein [Bathymodiolus thermophilus thioautotrophic gill symbiont]OIR24916.1 hypothetical protein BGC33_12105 [Bathymodiolus thermophilus thioautotrophic gill symbiont]